MTVAADPIDLDELEQHRRELTGYCYRMLGSGAEAEDAAQEAIVRAWQAADRFEGRSSVRSWLYRIATNVCLDALRSRQRRARPVDLGPPSPADAPLPAPLPESSWVSPIADDRVLPPNADPSELAEARESIRLAFVAALQHLPPRQRAVLVLREVLRWQATEVAELLDTTVASVNSALQRARATLAALDLEVAHPAPVTDAQRSLLERYVDAFERYDIPQLVAILREDAVMTMPPFPLWLRGADEIGAFFLGTGLACKGSRLVATRANGRPAYASYKPSGDGGFSPWAVHILELDGDRIAGHHSFVDLDGGLFAAFGLPGHLDD